MVDVRLRALLVVNPAAGHRTAGLLSAVAQPPPEHRPPPDLARRAIAERYDACIVAGGDGTVAPAAAALIDTDVTLGILPFGSFMNIAHGLGIPLVPIDAAAVIARRTVHRADVGDVHGSLFWETA